MTVVLDNAAARSVPHEKTGARTFLRRASFTWERGVLAIVGTPADGSSALLDLVAGRTVLDGGRCLVDHVPIGHASLRARVAHVPAEAALPEALRVDEVCQLARSLRGDPPIAADALLGRLGISALASRRVESLTAGESRAVLLAIAIASSAKVLLVEEPLATLDPAAPSRVVDALRARGAAGAAVIVTTASVRDATRLADQLGLLTQGVFTHLPPALAHVGPAGAKLRVVVRAERASEASTFVAALAGEEAVGSVDTVAAAPTPLRAGAVAIAVSGPDLLALARAVGAAASRTNAAIETIESAVQSLDAIRAALVAPRAPTLPSVPPAAAEETA